MPATCGMNTGTVLTTTGLAAEAAERAIVHLYSHTNLQIIYTVEPVNTKLLNVKLRITQNAENGPCSAPGIPDYLDNIKF